VIIVGSTFATDADFALHCIPGSPWRASIGYSWTVLIWTITKRKGPRARRALGPLHFIEPTWTVFKLKPAWLKGEARRAKAKFWVWFFCEGTGTNCEACDLNFGTAQVIMRKGVSKGTNTSCCHPVSVSELSRETKPYYQLHGYNGLRATFEWLALEQRATKLGYFLHVVGGFSGKIWQPCSWFTPISGRSRYSRKTVFQLTHFFRLADGTQHHAYNIT